MEGLIRVVVGGGTPLYGLYRYVRTQWAWFFGHLVINRVWFLHS